MPMLLSSWLLGSNGCRPKPWVIKPKLSDVHKNWSDDTTDKHTHKYVSNLHIYVCNKQMQILCKQCAPDALNIVVEPYRKIFAKTMAIPNDGTVFFSVFEGDPEIHRICTEIHHYVPHGHLAWLESLRTSSLHIPSLSSFAEGHTIGKKIYRKRY